ncbi:hypothetical protein TNCV_1184021 [Trichonephila clavipes]|nr:hypothetical protein TNCV_1184021 [Trichonephila clavipes]
MGCCTIMHEPQVLVRRGQYSMQQLRENWENCIRAGFFNPTIALQSPYSFGHSPLLVHSPPEWILLS